MLVNSNKVISNAIKEGYAIGAYNINNLEWTKYILEECNNQKSPVILQVSVNTVKYFGGYNVVVSIVKSLIKDLNIIVPVVLHLDHARSFYECKEAIDAGFTSVMIDLSDKTLDDNIDITTKVVCYAKKHDVSVEGELGSIDDNKYSDVDDCMAFVSSTGIDMLAPAVGNKHGIYGTDDKINFDLLADISRKVKIPLVLHGASGLDENKIKTAIFCGVCKINVNTDLQLAWFNKIKKVVSDGNTYDPKKIMSLSEDALKEVIKIKNNWFGNINRAN